ncbi:tyrosine-type recombinase/integrase [Xenorhabdus bovienii]|uniref:tyrosine-type recombinase/integrase n=1 Tax=Xenorhabdus bovienii TaxID=40576 RepID=UPI00237C9667|nr:site-specific integrase [Xenorhabdus bovienii]MDE1486232.1 tyrosine-type recombinase/integrase [Xenorhabdus bovienii]MDE9529905.1 tyrosine-type recombinase/integrase [Xenorhabdus bovienii]
MLNNEEKMGWDALLDEYFFSRMLRPATEWSYRKVVRVFIRYLGETGLPESVTHRDVLCWRRHLLMEKNQSGYTWNNKVAHLRAIFNFGMERKLLSHPKNPFNDAAVKKEKKQKKTLSKAQITGIYLRMQQYEEEERLQTSPRGGRCALYPTGYWLTVLDTFRLTGMRLNQLLHLRLRDINLDNSYIELRVEGSKNHSEWRVPMIPQLKPRLAQLVEQAKACGAKEDDPLFDLTRLRFCHHGRHVSHQYHHDREKQHLRSFFNRLSKECGFAVSPHRFRHTLATELMKAPDRNLQLVRCLLGHRSVATTMEYIDIDMEIAGKTLANELAFYLDLAV